MASSLQHNEIREQRVVNIPQFSVQPTGAMQQFESGATRSSSEGKNDYEGFLSFRALEAYGNYMRRHQITADGSRREADNWKQGIPMKSYVKSLVRHALQLMALWGGYIPQQLRVEYPLRAHDRDWLIEETACALLFNVQGFIHEWTQRPQEGEPIAEQKLQGGAELCGTARPTAYMRSIANRDAA